MGIEKCIVDDIAACPLRLLNYPQVRAKLKSKLSNYVGVMGIKANFDKNFLKNPFTQAKILVNSGFMNQPTDRDTFRFHFYNIEPMIKIVQFLGYPNDKELIPHYNRTKALSSIFKIKKK